MIPEYFALRTVKYGAPFFAELLKEFGNTSMPLVSYIYIYHRIPLNHLHSVDF